MAKRKRKKEVFSRYDTAEYLKSVEDIVAYLKACIEDADDDPAFIGAAIGNISRSNGMAKLAQKTRLTQEGLYKALSTESSSSLRTFLRY